MYSLIVMLPLMSAMMSGLFGSKLGEKGCTCITIAIIGFCLLISSLIYMEITFECSMIQFSLWTWFSLGFFYNCFGLYFDEITASMLMVVTSISSLVHLYSSSYMKGDPHLPRFMSYLSLFTFFMLILVTSDNLIQLFMGWEGVGLCSYLLMNFWFTSIQANKAAIKAMLVNSMGDMGLLLAIFLMWLIFGTLEFSSLFSSSQLSTMEDSYMFFMCLFLLMGAVGKSAQLGLHTWLPDAMEGPTPVSALIHAATMVTAGVFLMISMSPIFELSSSGLIVTTIMGSFTAFFAATVGLAQNDLKKVMAYSTCSQLGYMVMMCGLSHYSTGLFHLFNHAFFKALLFLSAGSVIHALSDEQDMSKMGSLISMTPFSYIAMFIGSISLMGLPFLTGFYSKDFILELAMDKMFLSFALWLGLLAAFFTAFYSFSLMFYTFMDQPTTSKSNLQKAHEGDWNLIFPLMILLMASVIMGYLFQFSLLKDISPPMMLTRGKWTPFMLSIMGASLSLMIYKTYKIKFSSKSFSMYMIMYSFMNSAWQFNYVINHFIVRPMWKFGLNITYNKIDRQLLEYLGPEGVLTTLTKVSSKNSLFQSGWLMNYILIFMFFLTLYLFII